ncbi:glycerophosphodiester phosphodiesterase [Pararcticibacter amylolyticus]|uniref:Glycerophosphodiester phosphodiesterase n=2 Tax=Pararcticibacter amylolyticus TaxID=2173175 RepID=A0A2U2PHB9_9SPHI|nr:glycerophosphodiester phosphodiesterase [Pararcticibacter amylolyticus]
MLLFGYSQTSFGQVAKLIQQLYEPNDKQVMVAAHRGDWRNAPENSLQAYKLAIAEGVDIVELDLKMSKDSVLVILHDQTLNRSTTGKGKPSDFTLAELKRLNLRDGLGAPTSQRIPTLEDVMLLTKGKVLVNLDHSTPFYKEAFAVLKKTGTLSQALFKSDEHYSILHAMYGSILDSITFMPVVETDYGGNKQMILDYQKHLKPAAVELVFEHDTIDIFKRNEFIKKGGSRIWVNTLWANLCGGHNDDVASVEGKLEESWGWLIARGVNIIQTDRPHELIAYLRKRKLHK